METVEFLDRLFGARVGPDARLVIWTLYDKKAQFFESIPTAANYALDWNREKGAKSDVYFGVGLVKRGLRGRGKARDVVALTALWADVDLYSPGVHDDDGLPHRFMDAKEIWGLATPSVITSTGHGVQAFWKLSSPFEINGQDTRNRAYAISRSWAETLAAHAANLGMKYDTSTSDVSRVLRVPGTYNFKTEPKLCEVIFEERVEYSLDQIETLLVAPSAIAKKQSRASDSQAKPGCRSPGTAEGRYRRVIEEGGNFVIRTSPPIELLDLAEKLCEQDPAGWGKTWRMENKKFGLDCSRYTMSLANFCVSFEHDNQMIVDMLVHFQRRWTAAKEPNRPVSRHDRQWYLRTIHMARFERCSIDQQLDGMAVKEVTESEEGVLEYVRSQLGLPTLQYIRQRGSNLPAYYLVTDEGEYALGGEGVLFDFSKVRARLLAKSVGKICLHGSLRKQWDRMAALLAKIIHYQPDDNEPVEQLACWLDLYVMANPPYTGLTWREAVSHGSPFINEKEFGVTLNGLRRWMRTHQDVRMSEKQVSDLLGMGGFRRVARHTENRATSRSYYVSFLENAVVPDVAKKPKDTRADS